MPAQGPIITILPDSSTTDGLDLTGLRNLGKISTNWSGALAAIAKSPPAGVVAVAEPGAAEPLAAVAARLAALEPYVPMIGIGIDLPGPPNVIPFAPGHDDVARVHQRLNAAMRVHHLHGTVLRRLPNEPTIRSKMPTSDPLQDANILLIGRGRSYPALSVALGVRVGVVGALSIESAAKHLNARDFDGIIIGDGFSERVVTAFLTVLSEDTRFRNLPVLVAPTAAGTASAHALPNLEFAPGTPEEVAERALPLVRQHAFEARLIRVLKTIEADGLLDPRTGLLTNEAFERDFAVAVADSQKRNAALSVVCFMLDSARPRERIDAARIVSRLMRRTDFASYYDDGSIIISFVGADAKNVQLIAKRLSNVLKYSVYSARRTEQVDVNVSVATLDAADTPASLLARLNAVRHKAAS
ncbi:MAG TPA: GGDEF domain-containing protein [Xanthobacteraceae bacterium]|nr:GGDEF domain-containing protein [Xanthobacteraceae bacterium]